MDLRKYQQEAISAVHAAWAQGARRVCLVMPTGSGKTITAQAITSGAAPLWLVHRREIRHQAPGRAVTIQGLLASGERPRAEILIADECHHLSMGAPEWFSVAESYPKILGLTATPQRGDGTPLGDLFDALIVGAKYSELLLGGWLVPARVMRPPEPLAGLAQKPADAWQKFAEGKRGFAYFSRIEHARKFAREMQTEIITAETPTAERDHIIDRFRRGEVRVMSNVFTLTEGIDIPEASVCMIARGCQHHGTYLQIVGRVLRPAPGKTEAIIIDLPGASHLHGMPTCDREYSLDGRAIRAKVEPLRVCPACGLTQPSALSKCERCNYEWPPLPARVRIWNLPLSDAMAQAITPKDKAIARRRAKWAAMSEVQRREEFGRLRTVGEGRGYKPGWAAYQYKLRFGTWPLRKY